MVEASSGAGHTDCINDACGTERINGADCTDGADRLIVLTVWAVLTASAGPHVLIAWKMLAVPLEMDVLMVSKMLESSILEPGVIVESLVQVNKANLSKIEKSAELKDQGRSGLK